MNRLKLLGAVSLVASLLAAPAFAQNNNAPVEKNTTPMLGEGGYTGTAILIQKDQNKNQNNNNNANNNRPSQRNPLLADNGYARAGKVIGTDVYNAQDQKLGSVDTVLIGKNGVFAVIDTNNKKVAVPFDQLKFGDAAVNGDEKLVLPNMTEAQLNTLEAVHYNATNYPANNGNNGNNNGGLFGTNGAAPGNNGAGTNGGHG